MHKHKKCRPIEHKIKIKPKEHIEKTGNISKQIEKYTPTTYATNKTLNMQILTKYATNSNALFLI